MYAECRQDAQPRHDHTSRSQRGTETGERLEGSVEERGPVGAQRTTSFASDLSFNSAQLFFIPGVLSRPNGLTLAGGGHLVQGRKMKPHYNTGEMPPHDSTC